MSKRRLPEIATEADRVLAARIAADRLCADLREGELARSLWNQHPPEWEHFIDSAGAITSERQK